MQAPRAMVSKIQVEKRETPSKLNCDKLWTVCALNLGKIKGRLSKQANGVFKTLLYELDSEHLSLVDPRINVSYTWTREDNYDQVLAFREENVAKSFKSMLDVGQKGIFAIHRGRTVAHCWALTAKNVEPGSRVNGLISLREDEAYIHFCHTDRNYRGNNIYPFLLSVLSKHLFEVEKMKAIFIDTSLDNIASQKGIRKVGFQERYLITTLRLVGKTWIRTFKSL